MATVSTKLSALSTLPTSLQLEDLLYVVDDPTGNPSSWQLYLSTLKTAMVSSLQTSSGWITGLTTFRVAGNASSQSVSTARVYTSSVTIGTGNSVDQDLLLHFNTDRGWAFYASGEGASQDLVLRSLVGGKTFAIETATSTVVANFLADDTNSRISTIGHISTLKLSAATNLSSATVSTNTVYTSTVVGTGRIATAGNVSSDSVSTDTVYASTYVGSGSVSSRAVSTSIVRASTFTGIGRIATAGNVSSATISTQHLYASTLTLTVSGDFASGTRMLFNQTNAPSGWTKVQDASYHDSILRFTSTSIVTSGSVSVSSHFATGRTVSSHILTSAEIPTHGHGQRINSAGDGTSDWRQWTGAGGTASTIPTSVTLAGTNGGVLSTQTWGSGGGHSHDLTNFNVKIADVIVATKD